MSPSACSQRSPRTYDHTAWSEPQGCTNANPGCAYLQHPYKRWARGEVTLAELNERTAK
jgi:hypothetical protein